MVLVGGLALVMPSHDKKPTPSRAPAPAAPTGVVDRLAAVCSSKATPIKEAATYDGKPGTHQVELVMVPTKNGFLVEEPERIALAGAGWGKPQEDADVDLAKAEVVGCYVIAKINKIRDCGYDAFGASTDHMELPLFTTSGRVVVREAATGKELGRHDIAAPTPPGCPMLANSSETSIVEHPITAVKEQLRRYRTGT